MILRMAAAVIDNRTKWRIPRIGVRGVTRRLSSRCDVGKRVRTVHDAVARTFRNHLRQSG